MHSSNDDFSYKQPKLLQAVDKNLEVSKTYKYGKNNKKKTRDDQIIKKDICFRKW